MTPVSTCLATTLFLLVISVESFQSINRISITANDSSSGGKRTISTHTAASKLQTTVVFLSTITNPNDDESNKYRNRSILLENTLRQKVQALKLSDQKLVVLQDAVKRVMAARSTEHDAEEALDSAEMQVLEWKARYERAETLRLEVASELSDVQRQHHERKAKMQSERDRLIQDMESLQKTYRMDQKQWEADVQTHMQAQKKLVELDRDHKRTLRQIDLLRMELEETRQELAGYRSSAKKSFMASSNSEEALKRERERVKSLKAQWADLKVEKQHLEDIRAAHADSIQIAEASVAASERREADLQREIAELNAKYLKLVQINKDLQLKTKESSTIPEMTEVVVEPSRYVVEQEHDIHHAKVPSELPKKSRIKRVASAVFSPVKRWREKRPKQQRR